jgi:RNA polymerase sigma factor (sigma-70 family)
MKGGNRSLATRWSMLDDLDGRNAEESWRWFIDRYRSYIRTCLHRLIRSSELAEQANDDVWSYLFTSSMIENADRNRRFRAYLAGTVRNFALGWLRKHQASEQVALIEAGSSKLDPSRQYEQQEMQLWTRQVVQLALSELSKVNVDQARALRWFYGLPTTVGEACGEPRSASWIAQQLATSGNAVHQLLFRARSRLQFCIENELRETVHDAAQLDDERRLVYAVIAVESPGLEPE